MFQKVSSFKEIKEKNKKKNFIEREANLPVIQSFPLVAKIEVTNRCNLSCIMCRQGKREEKVNELDFNVFKKLKEIFPTLLSAYLYGIGEVLTYPSFMELVDYLLSFEVNVGLLTNGILIDNKLGEEWVKKGLYKLSISVDGARRETYERIRRGASYDRLFANIDMINSLKKEYDADRPIVTFNFVVMKDNICELPDLVDLAYHFGAQEVIVNDLIVFFDNMREQVLSYDDPLCKENFSEAERRAKRNGIKLFLPVPYRFQKSIRPCLDNKLKSFSINPCTEAWSGFWLTADGIVTPCCYWMKPMGNLKHDNFLTIWNNNNYQHLRKTVNTEKRNNLCRRCAIAGMEKRE